MSENITIHEVRDPGVFFPMDRDAFYDEQIKVLKKTGQATKGVEVVGVLLFNREKDLILQKRSHEKRHNPFLVDKAIGGHVVYGNSPLYTVMVETVQELRVPSIVLRSDEDFKKTLALLRGYLDNIAIVKELDTKTFDLERVIDGEKHVLPHLVHLYIGVYGGATKPVDREASGVLIYSLDILKREMVANPNLFTGDLLFYLKKYEKEIQEFLKHLD